MGIPLHAHRRRAPRAPPLLLVAAALLLAPALAPAGAAGSDAGDHQWRLRVEVAPDLSERLTLTIAFDDADVRHRFDALCLPAGAEPVALRADGAPHDFQVNASGGRARVSFEAAAGEVTLEMRRGPPPAPYAPLVQRDAAMCLGAGAPAELEVTVPEGFTLFAASPGARVGLGGDEARLETEGPATLQYAYEAPLATAPGVVVFEEGPFRVFAPEARADAARRVTEVAADAAPDAFREAGVEPPWDHVRVRFAPRADFDWEEGRYVGNGIVVVQDEALAPDPMAGFPWLGARTLVHEAFHAASVPYGQGALRAEMGWFVEGAASHAEHHVLEAYPEAARNCRRGEGDAVRCVDLDPRLTAGEVADAYARGFTFDPDWNPKAPQSPATRQFYYRYSEFVVAAYVDRFGASAYREVWEDVEDARAGGAACPCDPGWLLRSMAAHADAAVGANAIYHPWRPLLEEDRGAFRRAVADVVAPG